MLVGPTLSGPSKPPLLAPELNTKGGLIFVSKKKGRPHHLLPPFVAVAALDPHPS